MKSANFKHAYAFAVLAVTVLWAVFCVWITYQAIMATIANAPMAAVNVLGAAGADTLLGALITYNSLIVQHYYRKATPEDNPPTGTTNKDKTSGGTQ